MLSASGANVAVCSVIKATSPRAPVRGLEGTGAGGGGAPCRAQMAPRYYSSCPGVGGLPPGHSFLIFKAPLIPCGSTHKSVSLNSTIALIRVSGGCLKVRTRGDTLWRRDHRTQSSEKRASGRPDGEQW